MITDITEEQITTIENHLKRTGIWFKKDHPLKYETYFKTGGCAKIFITPNSTEELANTVNFLYQSQIKYKVIGLTSNILLFDEIHYSVIISTTNMKKISLKESWIEVGCGYSLQDFVRIAIINGVEGYEGLEGIPGSIGGGVFMNAGAYGYEIATNIISIQYIDETGTLKSINKNECNFGYRKSFFKNSNHIIASVKFKFKANDSQEEIVKRVERYHIARHSYQEFAYPNLGSMFSVNRDFYKEIIKNESKTFQFLYYALKIITKNPAIKFINRRSPNSSALNWLILKKIKSKKYLPSKKGMNVLINTGRLTTKESFEYIFEIKERLGERYHIENESILGPIYKINPEFLETYRLITENLEKP
ncbi:UDP-N-acetylmuramate dehydrogenase [Pseudomonas sp. SIMBA_077]